ncbi:hypothetical protein H8356DRAFT_1398273 [Neocallimastix lanati (nom. inval.)]|nr:hypothetical protein H8356DRAFT_1398273 [Neocallimastix sp. JGI-2020a]
MSLCFILAIYIFFALYFQCGYSKVYDVESDDLPYDFAYHVNATTNSIEECEFCWASLCKGSYCFKADKEIKFPFIEIPINTNISLPNNNSEHQKNKVNRYITFPYVDFFSLEKAYKTSVKCSKDSQCFTNKCVNNDCVFNEKRDIKLCVDGHCGRFMGDPCTTRDECAEGDYDGVCHYPEQPEGETDIEYTLKFLSTLGFLIIIVIIVCCIACYNSNTKVSNTESHKQYTGIN